MKSEEVLELCLRDTAAGKATAAECAARFSDIPDLETQLRLAQKLRAMPAPTPRPEVRRRQEAELRRYAQTLLRPRPRWGAALRLALTTCAVGLLVLGLGLVAGAQRSLPGEPLYGVKRAAEAAQLTLTPRTERATQYLVQAQHRLAEIDTLSERDRVTPDGLALLLEDLTRATQAALAAVNQVLPEQQVAVLDLIVVETERQQVILTEVRAEAPAEAQASLEAAMSAANQSLLLAAARRDHDEQKPANPATPSPTFLAATRIAPTQTPIPPTLTQLLASHTPPATRQIQIPPGETQIPPDQTDGPPSQTHRPPGQTQGPPGQTQGPLGQTHGPPTSPPPQPTALPPTPCPTNPGGQPVCH